MIVRLLALVVVLAAGCTSTTVSEATCSTCSGVTFDDAECADFARLAGCEKWGVQPSSAGCTGCSFEDCETPPDCSPGVEPTDAGSDATTGE